MSKKKDLPYGMTENMVKIMEVSMLAREKGLKSYENGTAKLDTSGMVAKKPKKRERLCKRCGKPLERLTNGKRYCDECADLNRREQHAETYKKWKDAHPQTQQFIKCAKCGRVVPKTNGRMKYCDECKVRVKKAQDAARCKERRARAKEVTA